MSRSTTVMRRLLPAGLGLLLGPVAVHSELVPCRHAADARQIAGALRRIQRSADPCGESAQISDLMARLQRCAGYEICTSASAARNLFERPSPQGDDRPRTITWNPALRSELERGCDGDAAKPVLRDPTASLLHELVHAVHDCEGLNPGEHEFEAVRVENIYRRAAGLCQRSRYGDDPLPADMVRVCSPGRCACSAPPPTGTGAGERARAQRAGSTDGQVADSVVRPGGIGVDPAR